MKVDEFSKLYGIGFSYATDQHMLDRNKDAEVLAYAVGKARRPKSNQPYASCWALIYRSQRKLVAYINGRRVDPSRALNYIKDLEVVKEVSDEAVKEVTFDAV